MRGEATAKFRMAVIRNIERMIQSSLFTASSRARQFGSSARTLVALFRFVMIVLATQPTPGRQEVFRVAARTTVDVPGEDCVRPRSASDPRD